VFLKWENRDEVKIPKKYKPISCRKGYVIDKWGERYIINRRVAGTPKFETLSGNKFYSGYGNSRVRAMLMDKLKDDFRKKIKKYLPIKIRPEDFPIRIDWDIFSVKGKGDWDLDNLWFYRKAFVDVLKECKVIPDDSIEYVTGFDTQWYEIPEGETRMLIFTFSRNPLDRSVRELIE